MSEKRYQASVRIKGSVRPQTQASVASPRQISVAVPAWNASKFIADAINPFVVDDRVSEIIVVDDCSDDSDDLNVVLEKIHKTNPGLLAGKIKLFRNSANLGCLRNKFKAVSLCNNERVLLFDADNIPTEGYLDALFSVDWDPMTTYAPEWAISLKEGQPTGQAKNLNFTAYAGITFDSTNCGNFLDGTPDKFCCMLNTCNWFVSRELFMKALTLESKNTTRPEQGPRPIIDMTPLVPNLGCDSMFINTCLFIAGARLHVLEGLRHLHRLHENSSYSLRDDAACEEWRAWSLKQLNAMKS